VIDPNRMLSRRGVDAASLQPVDVCWSDGILMSAAASQFLRCQIPPVVDRIGAESEAAARAHA